MENNDDVLDNRRSDEGDNFNFVSFEELSVRSTSNLVEDYDRRSNYLASCKHETFGKKTSETESQPVLPSQSTCVSNDRSVCLDYMQRQKIEQSV